MRPYDRLKEGADVVALAIAGALLLDAGVLASGKDGSRVRIAMSYPFLWLGAQCFAEAARRARIEV